VQVKSTEGGIGEPVVSQLNGKVDPSEFGMVVTLATATESISPTMRLFLATGICGGFTTMSSFIYELVQFVKDHEYLYAGAYFSLTLVGCMAMFCLGAWLVQWTLKA